MRQLRLRIVGAAALAVLALGAMAGTASAADTVNFGPYASDSTDSGTCGPDWANDTFARSYRVYPERNVDGSYRFQENFSSGHFTTIQGVSPESCEAGTANQVSGNFKGTVHGFFVVKVSGGTFNPNATCTAKCYTADFVSAFFGSSATYNVTDYWFKYHTGNSAACARTWINAATGNSGDIATICS